MRSEVFDVITDCIRNNPKGGEQFFDELDENLRTVETLQELLFEVPRRCNNVVCSGKFGKFLADKTSFSNLVMVEGGLRKGNTTINLDYMEEFIKGRAFVFIDDSYYSGSTFKTIQKEIERLGGDLVCAYVVYDGSLVYHRHVKSLYRYYAYHSKAGV